MPRANGASAASCRKASRRASPRERQTGPAREMSNLQLRIISSVVLDRRGAGRHLARRRGLPAALCVDRGRRSSTNGARCRGPRRPPSPPARRRSAASAWCWSRWCWAIRRLAFSFCSRCRFWRACSTAGWRGQGLSGRRSALPMPGSPACRSAFLRDGDQPGLIAILFLFAVVWATDIFAYFVGRVARRPEARALDLARQDAERRGRRHGRRRRRRHRARGLRRARQPAAACAGRAPAFGRLAGRRPLQILGQAASRREGFGQHHSRPWRRHGPGRRACRGGLCPIRHRLRCSAAPTSLRKGCLQSEAKAADLPLIAHHWY